MSIPYWIISTFFSELLAAAAIADSKKSSKMDLPAFEMK